MHVICLLLAPINYHLVKVQADYFGSQWTAASNFSYPDLKGLLFDGPIKLAILMEKHVASLSLSLSLLNSPLICRQFLSSETSVLNYQTTLPHDQKTETFKVSSCLLKILISLIFFWLFPISLRSLDIFSQYTFIYVGIYRVIRNGCRGFNNLSYTIHLR